MPLVRVRPTGDATHQISLSDGKRSFGIKLKDGSLGVVESPATPTTVRTNAAGTKYGDFDPSMAHLEQRDWSGGRGLENWVDDPSRYFDGTAWTLTPDVMHSALQWQLTTGTMPWNADLPGSVTWKSLVGDNRFISRRFNPTTTYNCSQAYVWLKRVGNPGNPAISIYSSGTAVPGAATATQTATASEITQDVVSVLFQSTWAAVSLSTVATNSSYWMVVAGNSSDTVRDHWEVGCGSSGSGGQISSNGTAWTAAGFYPYFLTRGPNLNVKWHFFALSSGVGTSQVLHAVSQHNSSVDPSSTVRLTSTGGWSTIAWTSALAGVVTDVTVLDRIAYMGRVSTAGGTTSLFQAQVQASSNAGNTMGATDVGDFVHAFYDPVDGPQLVRAVSTASRVYRASTVAFGTTMTWKPSTGVPVGDAGAAIIDIEDYDNQMYARKQDSLWAIKLDRAAKINVGLDDFPSTGLYSPMLAKELYLYLSWSYSLERLYGGTLDDVGLWRGAGLPSSRVGVVSCLEGVIGWLFAGVDAGATGVSGVYAWDGRGWHEVFRAPVAGWRVQNIKWWAPPATRPRLLISCGGMIFSIAFPYRNLHPSRDAGADVGSLSLTFQHESVMETGTFDMGAQGLPKLFSEFQAQSEGLTSTGIDLSVDYQLDEEIGGSTWITVPGAIQDSPDDSLDIRRGNKHAIRLRYRMNTNNNAVPVLVKSTVLKAVARTPVKRRWAIRSKSGSFQVDEQGNNDAKPDDVYMQFQDWAVATEPLHMRSVWKAMDDVYVYMEPPVIRRTYRTPSGEWGFEGDITIREV